MYIKLLLQPTHLYALPHTHISIETKLDKLCKVPVSVRSIWTSCIKRTNCKRVYLMIAKPRVWSFERALQFVGTSYSPWLKA